MTIASVISGKDALNLKLY